MVFFLAVTGGLTSIRGQSDDEAGGIDEMATAYHDRWVSTLTLAKGYKALRALPGLRFEGGIHLEGQENNLGVVIEQLRDGSYREETARPDVGLIVDGYDGHIGWRFNASWGVGLIDPIVAEQRSRWTLFRLALGFKRDYAKARFIRDMMFEGIDCHVIELSPVSGDPERWGFDYKSGMLSAVYCLGGEDRAPETVVFGDFRNTAGLRLPFTYTLLGTGRTVLQFETIAPIASPDLDRFTPSPEIRAQIERLREMEDRYLNALGGKEAIARVRTRVSTFTEESISTGLKTTRKITQKEPYFVLVEDETPGVGRSLMGFDGKTPWAYSDVVGYRILKGEALAELFALSGVKGDSTLFRKHPFAKVHETQKLDSMDVTPVAFANFTGPRGLYFFSNETGQLVRVEGKIGSTGIQATIRFSDFRSVGGVVMPFLTELTGSTLTSRSVRTSVETNVTIDDRVFAPRKDGE